MKLDQFNLQDIHSADLTTDSTLTSVKLNWKPDYFVVVARLSVGYIWIYPYGRGGAMKFRLDRGTLRLPVFRNTDTLAIETVGATGFYDAYAVLNMDGMELEA